MEAGLTCRVHTTVGNWEAVEDMMRKAYVPPPHFPSPRIPPCPVLALYRILDIHRADTKPAENKWRSAVHLATKRMHADTAVAVAHGSRQQRLPGRRAVSGCCLYVVFPACPDRNRWHWHGYRLVDLVGESPYMAETKEVPPNLGQLSVIERGLACWIGTYNFFKGEMTACELEAGTKDWEEPVRTLRAV